MEKISGKISQLAVQFACTIPLKPELKPSERDALKLALEALDPEHFQLFGNIINPANPNEPILFSTQRQYQIDSGLATAPSLVFAPGAITILHAVKIGEKFLSRDKELTGAEYNLKARETLFKIQDVLKIKFTRAGKIFEFVAGPFIEAEKKRLLQNLVVFPHDDLSELQLVYNKVVNTQQKVLNVNTQLRLSQMKLEDPIQLLVKVDINNRKHEQSLEQRDVDYIWKEADKAINPHIDEILGLEG